MATLADVATRAGVSPSTVSYALSGARPISETTRRRVFDVMSELGYRPNALARGLAARRSTILGLAIPLSARSLGATEGAFISGTAQAAGDAGYHLTIVPIGATQSGELGDLLGTSLLDGVIAMEVYDDDPRVEVARAAGVPLVLIGRTRGDCSAPYVDIDFDATVADALNLLVEAGHTHVALMTHAVDGPRAGYGAVHRARDAFTRETAARGLTGPVIAADDSALGGREATARLLSSHPEVTAILVMNEYAAFGILNELHARDLRVPRDMSVVSLVTTPDVADLTTPTLTAFLSPGHAMGARAVEILLDTIRGHADTIPQELMSCTLRHGDSVAEPRADALTRRRTDALTH